MKRNYKTCLPCDTSDGYNLPKSKYPLYYNYCPNCSNELTIYTLDVDVKKPRQYYRVPANAIQEHSVNIENKLENIFGIGSPVVDKIVSDRKIIHTITFEGKKPLKIKLDANGVVNKDWGL